MAPPPSLSTIDVKPPKFRRPTNENLPRRKGMADSRGRYDQTGFDQGRFNKGRKDIEEDSIEWDTPTSVSDFGSFGAKAGGFFGSSSTRDDEDTSTPSWFDSPIDSSNGRGKVGHSVREFEEWKAKMKIEELKKQGFEVNESDMVPESFNEDEDFFSSEHGHISSSSSSIIESKQPDGKSVDRLFSMWDEGMSSKAKSEEHSRFSRSRFFGASGSASQTPPAHRAPANISDPIRTNAQSPTEIPQKSSKDADKEGFQRIMMMLGNGMTPSPPNTANELAGGHQQHSQPQLPQERAPEAASIKPVNVPSGAPLGDDLFFQTLLNKGGQQPPPPAAMDSSSKSNAEQLHDQVDASARSTDPSEAVLSQNPMPPSRMLIDKDGNPFFLPPPPGMFVDKDGKPLPPDFMPYPPPMMFEGQQYPMPPPPFFGGPGGPSMHSPSAAGQMPAQMHGGFPGPNVGNNNWNRQPTH